METINTMQLPNSATDPRVIRTLTFIRDGFLKLLEERPLEKITLEDIAAAGLTSRNTVSKYYANRYELMDELCLAALQEMDMEIEIECDDTRTAWERVVANIFADVEKNRSFFDLVIAKDRYPKFLIMLSGEITALFQRLIENAYGAELVQAKLAEIDSSAAFFVGGMRYWLKHRECSEEEFVKKWATSLDSIWRLETT